VHHKSDCFSHPYTGRTIFSILLSGRIYVSIKNKSAHNSLAETTGYFACHCGQREAGQSDLKEKLAYGHRATQVYFISNGHGHITPANF